MVQAFKIPYEDILDLCIVQLLFVTDPHKGFESD